MTANNSKELTAWARMKTATQCMHGAWEMISDAFWESYNSGDPIGVSDRLEKLMYEAKKLTTDMQFDTEQLFQNLLSDEKPTTAE